MLTQEGQDAIWKHFQGERKETFDLSYPRLRYFAEKCPPRTRVLNVGVGSGYLEKILTDRDVEVYALDPCEESIARLRADLRMDGRAQRGYSHDIPFAAGCFDKVIMTEVLEHLPDDALGPTLSEVRRVLKAGGEFVGTVPYRESLPDNEVICPHCHERFHRWGHLQTFDAGSLGDLLRGQGFVIDKLHPRSFPDFRRPGVKPLIKAAFRYVLGRMGEPLIGPNLYFVARSP